MDGKTVKRAWSGAESGVDNTVPFPPHADWDDFRVFAAVARELNFTKAATTLGYQQTTVSRRIEALEENLGVTLFDRTNRGLTLTAQGQRIVNDVEEASQLLSRARSSVRGAPEAAEGELRLAMSEGLAISWFAPLFLPIFAQRYPRVSLRLGVTNEQDGSIIPPYDIQVRFGQARDYPNLKTTRLATFHFMHFASQSYIDRFGMPKPGEDSRDHHIVDVMDSLNSKLGLTSIYCSTDFGGIPFATNSGQVAASAVAAGVAIGFLPTYAYVAMPELVPIPTENDLNTGVHLMFAPNVDDNPAARAMVEFLRNVVFNKRRMPWFAESKEVPGESWRASLNAFLEEQRAAEAP
jgi:DNA-binding transcriptional LysR family regulator